MYDEKTGVVIIRLVGVFFIIFAVIGVILLAILPYAPSLQQWPIVRRGQDGYTDGASIVQRIRWTRPLDRIVAGSDSNLAG